MMKKDVDILGSMMEDTNRIIGVFGGLFAILGCFLNFYSISYENQLTEGSLWDGYRLGGLFGKLSTLAVLAAVILLFLNSLAYTCYCTIASVALLVVQGLLVLIDGGSFYGNSKMTTVTPGLGGLVCLIGAVILLAAVEKSRKRVKKAAEQKQKEERKDEHESIID